MVRDGAELVIDRVVVTYPLLSLLVSKVGACECLCFATWWFWVYLGVLQVEECFMRVTTPVGCSSGGGSSICGSTSSSSSSSSSSTVVVEVVLVVLCRVRPVLCGRSPLIVTSTDPFLSLPMSRTHCLHLSLLMSPLVSSKGFPGDVSWGVHEKVSLRSVFVHVL